jgi:hypothetical protein
VRNRLVVCHRFAERRLDGLKNRPKCPPPRQYYADIQATLLVLACQKPAEVDPTRACQAHRSILDPRSRSRSLSTTCSSRRGHRSSRSLSRCLILPGLPASPGSLPPTCSGTENLLLEFGTPSPNRSHSSHWRDCLKCPEPETGPKSQ